MAQIPKLVHASMEVENLLREVQPLHRIDFVADVKTYAKQVCNVHDSGTRTLQQLEIQLNMVITDCTLAYTQLYTRLLTLIRDSGYNVAKEDCIGIAALLCGHDLYAQISAHMTLINWHYRNALKLLEMAVVVGDSTMASWK